MKDVLIKALRCSSSVHNEEIDCTECPYLITEKIPEECVSACGVEFWYGCDCDKICQDAADYLEELEQATEGLR